MAAEWFHYTVPGAEDAPENHLGINMEEDNLIFFIMCLKTPKQLSLLTKIQLQNDDYYYLLVLLNKRS